MTRDELRHIMKCHDWSMGEIAAIAMVSHHTVRAWLRPNTSKASRNMRPHAAELLMAACERAGKSKGSKSNSASTTPSPAQSI